MDTSSTVVIADGFEIVREGIANKLAEAGNIEVVGEAADGFTALKCCRTLNPDILLMDLDISRPNGLETLAKVRKSCPDTKVVVLSSETSITIALMALSQGAVAFMPKQSKSSDFVNAITAAANGFAYLPTDLLSDFVRSRRNISRTGNAFGLSPRELEILDACVNGQSTKEVAQSLEISVRTVETHRNSIYKKTSCNGLDDLLKVAASIRPTQTGGEARLAG